MKDKISKIYFSKIIFFCMVLVSVFYFSNSANAQIMTYGGRQLMYWGSSVCNSSNTNVHFILGAGGLTTLYDSPATRSYGNSNVEIGVSQIGTYLTVPTPCIVSGSPPIVIWVPNGTYIDASTSVGMKEKFFAGSVNPFVKGIKTKV
jgi:hypothetical protein